MVRLGFIPRLAKVLTERQCSVQVRAVGEQLFKGFSEFLGWESKGSSSAAAGSSSATNVADGDADRGIFAPLLPCIAPIIESFRVFEAMLGLA